MINPTELIPNANSSSASWIQWHKSMKSRYGKKQANMLFVKAWDDRGGTSSDASTNELRTYMKDNGVTLDTSTLQDIGDSTLSFTSGIGNIFTTGKYVAYTITGIVVVGLGVLVFNIVKDPIKSVSAASNLIPQKKVLDLLKK